MKAKKLTIGQAVFTFKFLSLSLLFVTVFFIGCKKESKPVQLEINNANIVGTWKMVHVQSAVKGKWNGSPVETDDVLSTWDPCTREYYMTLRANGTGRVQVHCNRIINKVYWELEDKELRYTDSVYNHNEERITSVTATEMKTADIWKGDNYDWVNVTITYQKQ